MGRFGNQLFQYAALRSLGIKNSFDIGLPNFKEKTFHGQINLISKLSIPQNLIKKISFFHRFTQKKFIEPNENMIHENFYSVYDNTDLEGYFQSIFYFKDYEEIIKKELKPKKIYLEKAKYTLDKIKILYPDYQIVSLHLRRGDNVDKNIKSNSKNLINSFGENDTFSEESVFGRYIKESKSQFMNKKVKFLVFTGGNRKNDDNYDDLDWCRKNLIGDEYIFIEPQKAFDDFCLIMQCDHNIISMASSFGWWAAYLNEKKDKNVIAPFFYNPAFPNIPVKRMFYPSNWKIIK